VDPLDPLLPPKRSIQGTRKAVLQVLPVVAMSNLPGWWDGGWMVWEEGDIG